MTGQRAIAVNLLLDVDIEESHAALGNLRDQLEQFIAIRPGAAGYAGGMHFQSRQQELFSRAAFGQPQIRPAIVQF